MPRRSGGNAATIACGTAEGFDDNITQVLQGVRSQMEITTKLQSQNGSPCCRGHIMQCRRALHRCNDDRRQTDTFESVILVTRARIRNRLMCSQGSLSFFRETTCVTWQPAPPDTTSYPSFSMQHFSVVCSSCSTSKNKNTFDDVKVYLSLSVRR